MCCRARDGQAGFVKSPITGELVAVDQMAEHMRISLIDPKWRTQREAMLAKIRETTKASDDEIGRNLVGLARHRPDVFGERAGRVVAGSMLGMEGHAQLLQVHVLWSWGPDGAH